MALSRKVSKGSAGLRTIFILNLVALLILGGAFAFFSLKNRKKITVRDLKAYEKIICYIPFACISYNCHRDRAVAFDLKTQAERGRTGKQSDGNTV